MDSNHRPLSRGRPVYIAEGELGGSTGQPRNFAGYRWFESISAGLIAPSRVVVNPVGWVGDHKVRRETTEHALNVGRHCAVAAEQSMTAEHP